MTAYFIRKISVCDRTVCNFRQMAKFCHIPLMPVTGFGLCTCTYCKWAVEFNNNQRKPKYCCTSVMWTYWVCCSASDQEPHILTYVASEDPLRSRCWYLQKLYI